MNFQTVLDKSYDKKQLDKYNLSLRIGIDSFIASVSRLKNGQIIGVTEKTFTPDFRSGFNLSAFIESINTSALKVSTKYHKKHISIANTWFAIVPSALFDSNQIQAYVELNVGPLQNVNYRFKTLKNLDIVVAYAVPKILDEWLTTNFHGAIFTHEMAVTIEANYKDFGNMDQDHLVINIRRNYFDMVYLKSGKFEFINSFDFGANEDLLYFILFSCEQLGINPHEIETTILGEVNTGSGLHQLLQQYIKKLSFGSRSKFLKVAPGLNHIPNHYFYASFNQNLCA